MRLALAIDRYLAQMQVEADWTPRTVDSVYRTLVKLADEDPEAKLTDYDGRAGTEKLRDHIGRHYGRLSASTRATRISYWHTFWAWADDEGYIDDDPARRIKRPPKRRADVYRPTSAELDLYMRACHLSELAPSSLMVRRGLRASTVCGIRWRDLDLQRERVRIIVKGGHRDWVPLGPEAAADCRRAYRTLEPDPDDHVFTAEEERWISQEHRRRTVIDPKTPRTPKALWRMVGRICDRAGIRHLGPHALRHGFATGFLRASERDTASLKGLLGHSRLDTTELYTDELDQEELGDALQRAADRRSGTTQSDATSVASTEDKEDPDTVEALNPANGGGGNRTRVRTESSSDDERHGTSDDDDPPLDASDRRL